METLAPNQMTLTPFPETSTEYLDRFNPDDPYEDRYVLTFAEYQPELDEGWTLEPEWQLAYLSDRRPVLVRRADCGLGCHCAGEFVLVAS